MLRGALGLGGPGSPRRKGQQQQEENGSRNGGGNGGAKLAAVLDAADGDDGALASPRGAAGGAAGEEDLAATAAGEGVRSGEKRKRKRRTRKRRPAAKSDHRSIRERKKGRPFSNQHPSSNQNVHTTAEHAARVRAEGAAADAARRLEVAQEQVHEYARARAQDAAEALAEAEAAVAKAASSSSSEDASLASLVALRDRLAQASEEAAAFAELTRADAERARRSAAAAAEAAASGVLLPPGGGALPAAAAAAREDDDEDGDVDMETSAAEAGPDAKRARESAGEEASEAAAEATDSSPVPAAAPISSSSSSSSQTMLERARYIPLRLTADERRMLALLKAALGVSQARQLFFLLTLFSTFFFLCTFCFSFFCFRFSRSSFAPTSLSLSERPQTTTKKKQYTDKVDVLSWRSKQARVTAQIRDMCAILSGLVVASDYRRGQQLVQERNFADNAEFFRDCFEVGRRHKVRRKEGEE